MSSRIVRRFAPAAILVASLAAPAAAQDKPVAPPPRAGVAHDFATHRRQMDAPRPLFAPVTHDQWIERHWQNMRDAFNVGPLPHELPACDRCAILDAAFVIGAGGLTRVMPLPEPPRFLVPSTPIPTGSFVIHEDGRVVVASAATKAVGCESCAAHSAKSDGTWYREVAGTVVAVTFAGDNMTAKMTARDGDTHATVTVTAHCTATKDGLVFGAITSADVVPLGDKTPKMELAELSMSLQELVDHPFSFRAKSTPEGLSVSGLKVSGFERDKKELLGLCGVYKHAKDGKIPEPKPQGAKVGRCEECRPVSGGPTSGTIEYKAVDVVRIRNVGPDGLERIGVDFSAPVSPPMAVPTAPTLAPRCVPLPTEVKPISVAFPNDAMKQMAADAFGQMMLPPATVPSTGGATLPRPQTWYGGMTLPSPKYLEHYPQYFAPDPAFPLPRELAAQEDPEGAARGAAAKSKQVGTWVREVGSKRCVLKVTADHFTLTVSEAHEIESGKTVTAHLTFTVEYHLSRDGVTAVGLVTGVDAKFDGDLPDGEAGTIVGKTGELQKLLEDMPLAATLRVYSDALVVGSVRMPTANGLMESEPTAYLNGRYRLMTEKALSPLKAVKAAPKPTYAAPPPPLPPGAYGTPIGAYGAPIGDLLPPQTVPNVPLPRTNAPLPPLPPLPAGESLPPTGIVPTLGVTVPEPLPGLSAPTAPARVMPKPKPPGAVIPVQVGEKQTYADDPNIRMQQLLYRNGEDVAPFGCQNEWRRFWFNDLAIHYGPERVHGDIR